MLGAPTIASTGTSTYTTAATLAIAGAPATGTGVTITNPLSLYVAAGTSSFGGNVGIGTASPQEPLDVAGPIKVAGTGSETCDTAHVGAIRYNPSTGLPQMCINH